MEIKTRLLNQKDLIQSLKGPARSTEGNLLAEMEYLIKKVLFSFVFNLLKIQIILLMFL